MLRLAHLVTHPIQYFAPLYRQITTDNRIDLTVYFGSEFGLKSSFDVGFNAHVQYDIPLLDGYRSSVLTNRGNGVPDGVFGNFDCPDIEATLRNGKYDAIWVHGWGYRMQWQGIHAARRLGIPYFVRAETHGGTPSKNFLRRAARRLVLTRMLRRACGCLYVGHLNRQFYLSMGVSNSRLFPAHYSVDAQQFTQARNPSELRTRVRDEWNTQSDDFVLITVAKAIPRKRIDDIIRAVGKSSSRVHLWVAGDGPQRSKLEKLAEEYAPERVHFLGFVNQSQLSTVMAGADAFVLGSSEEAWGLVANEAMACGLPILVSRESGCAPDLVVEGETGFCFGSGNVAELTHLLARFAADRSATAKMGRQARERMLKGYDSIVTARQIADGIESGLALQGE